MLPVAIPLLCVRMFALVIVKSIEIRSYELVIGTGTVMVERKPQFGVRTIGDKINNETQSSPFLCI